MDCWIVGWDFPYNAIIESVVNCLLWALAVGWLKKLSSSAVLLVSWVLSPDVELVLVVLADRNELNSQSKELEFKDKTWDEESEVDDRSVNHKKTRISGKIFYLLEIPR
jgi:hypothetical protein